MRDLILFTSNCFGEDRSAALIARELKTLLQQRGQSFRVMGASLISEGKDYLSRGIEIVYASHVPPSGGFPTHSLKGLLADLFSGSMITPFQFIKTLKSHAHKTKLAVVVGDVALLFLTRQGLPGVPLVFLSLPKSDYIAPHYPIEEWYIVKHTSTFLTRDAYTATNLQKKHIPALFLGNPIVDELEPSSVLSFSPEKPILGLLPGSRKEAYQNFVLMLPIVEEVFRQHPCHVVAALPPTLTDDHLATHAYPHGWNLHTSSPFSFLQKGDTRILLSRGVFAEVLHKSTVILGLAGTANEQAAALGKPVVTFRGVGPQTTERRFREQEKLLGGAVTYCRHYPSDVIREILWLFSNPEERTRRGAKGKEHMGPAGGARNIATYLIEHYLTEEG
ncbi:MAG: lipid-A-disaccharide synthase-related protein [Brevinematales bacterium]|nr:lipid-A-disaccharide synthase-related protein [Brevinematales bacterium]